MQNASAVLEELAKMLTGAVHVTRGRKSVRLPSALAGVLSQAVSAAIRGEAIALIPVEKKVTTQEAADLLGMSRQHLVRLLDAGSIKLRKSTVGTHRRISLKDVMHLREENARALVEAEEIAAMFNAAFAPK